MSRYLKSLYISLLLDSRSVMDLRQSITSKYITPTSSLFIPKSAPKVVKLFERIELGYSELLENKIRGIAARISACPVELRNPQLIPLKKGSIGLYYSLSSPVLSNIQEELSKDLRAVGAETYGPQSHLDTGRWVSNVRRRPNLFLLRSSFADFEELSGKILNQSGDENLSIVGVGLRLSNHGWFSVQEKKNIDQWTKDFPFEPRNEERNDTPE